MVDLTDDTFVRLPAVETVLETQEDLTELPVTLRASVSDVGILEVWAGSVDRDARYRLEFLFEMKLVRRRAPQKNLANLRRL